MGIRGLGIGTGGPWLCQRGLSRGESLLARLTRGRALTNTPVLDCTFHTQEPVHSQPNPPPCRFGTTTHPDQRHFIRTPHSAPTRLPGAHIASPTSAMRANHATNPVFCRRRMGTRFRRFVGYQPGTWSHSTSGETKCRATVASRMVWALGIYWIWGRSEDDPNDSGKHALPVRVGKILDGAHLGRAGCSPVRAWTVQGQVIAI